MNPFVVISLLSAIHFPDTNINHIEEVVNNIYNESVAENRVIIKGTCVTLDIDGAPELSSIVDTTVEAICFNHNPTEEEVKELLREGFLESLKIRKEIPLTIWNQ